MTKMTKEKQKFLIRNMNTRANTQRMADINDISYLLKRKSYELP